jgi:hypothetical protein
MNSITTPQATAGYHVRDHTPSQHNLEGLRLPNFIIGGAIKGGTTSLNYYLKQHPDVYMSAFKEPRYFAYDPANPEHVAGHGLRFPIKTLDEYAALFADSAGYRAVGETSPHYLRSDTAPQLIAAAIPDVRLIFSLRDPVRRAYSSYWHRVRLGLEDRPAEVVLQPGDQAVEHGLYHAWLTRWYEQFDPAQVKIILFDDLIADALGVVADICRFLKIDDSFVPDLSVKNRGGAMKNQRLGRFYETLKKHPLRRAIDPLVPARLRQKMIETRDSNLEEPPPMPADLARRLYDYYRDEVERLEKLIDRDLANWKK